MRQRARERSAIVEVGDTRIEWRVAKAECWSVVSTIKPHPGILDYYVRSLGRLFETRAVVIARLSPLYKAERRMGGKDRMNNVIAFLLGNITSGMVGVVVMCCCIVSGRESRMEDRFM